MEIEYLYYFNKIAETENILKSARYLSISQPALSRILKKIETSLETQLFDRNGKSLSLNDNGRLFYSYTRQIVDLWDNASAAFSLQKAAILNLTMLYSTKLLPDLIGDFMRSHPHIQLRVNRFVNDQSLIQDTDVMIHASNQIASSFHSHILLTEECLIGVSKDHPFAQLSEIPPEALKYEQFIVINEENVLRDLTTDFFHKLDITPRIAMVCDSLSSITSFVASNLGIAIFPTGTWDTSSEDIVFKAVADHPITRTIYISTMNPKPEMVISSFVNYICEEIAQRISL